MKADEKEFTISWKRARDEEFSEPKEGKSKEEYYYLRITVKKV